MIQIGTLDGIAWSKDLALVQFVKFCRANNITNRAQFIAKWGDGSLSAAQKQALRDRCLFGSFVFPEDANEDPFTTSSKATP